MKLLEFFVILGILFKGHYVSAVKLVNNYHNRNLLVKRGEVTKDAFVFYEDTKKCSVTRISSDMVASDKSCGDSINFCARPAEGRCPLDSMKGTGGAEITAGVNVYTAAGEGAPETGSEVKDCVVIGYGNDDDKIVDKTSAKVTAVTDDGNYLNVTMEKDKLLCAADKGGALVCGGKLAGIIIEAASPCVAAGRAVKVQDLLQAGGEGSEAGAGSTAAPGRSYAITPSMIVTALPIIIIACLNH